MADIKISALTELTAPASGDYIPIVDISEPADADKTKRVTMDTLHLPVFLTSPLSSTDYDGDAFSDTALTLIDLSAVYGVPAGISAVLLSASVNDSGSAANDTYFLAQPTSDAGLGSFVIRCSGLANDTIRNGTGICPCNADGDIYYAIEASGPDTLDLNLQIFGYWL
jgi:hypothetical protein